MIMWSFLGVANGLRTYCVLYDMPVSIKVALNWGVLSVCPNQHEKQLLLGHLGYGDG